MKMPFFFCAPIPEILPMRCVVAVGAESAIAGVLSACAAIFIIILIGLTMRMHVFGAPRVERIRIDVMDHLIVNNWHVRIDIFIREPWFASTPCPMIVMTVDTINSAQAIFQSFCIDSGTQFASVFHEFI